MIGKTKKQRETEIKTLYIDNIKNLNNLKFDMKLINGNNILKMWGRISCSDLIIKSILCKIVGFREASTDEPRLLNLYMRGRGDRYNFFNLSIFLDYLFIKMRSVESLL